MKTKKLLTTLGTAVGFSIAGSLIAVTLVLAAPNPSGTGQPGAECGEENATMAPKGFSSGGFAHAETVYAGSDGSASAEHSHSTHAVSQYDVACYQQTQNH
ncbi:MAG: hypothetical protein PHS53_02835 [Candidatus Pacebacteria bacterium]|nr:hypothetical protein [Candidatus Paceibacterota bacterium]MDD5357060.1 hypothetical protein [Candidatus Paceibacterota bacterium]